MVIEPSLKPGDQVKYVEDGVVSMFKGTVLRPYWNDRLDRVEYVVK